MCLICNQPHLTSCTAAFFVVYFWRDVMLEMVLFIFEMLPATVCALLTSLAAPASMCAHWQSCQLDVWNKAAPSKQCSEGKSTVWVGIEGLQGWDLMNRKGWSGCWSDAMWSGKGREERMWFFFYICRVLNSPVNLLVIGKTQLWEKPRSQCICGGMVTRSGQSPPALFSGCSRRK